MQNQKTEEICENIKETDEEIERIAKMRDGCKVMNMREHILSDICIMLHEKSIPTLKECHHTDMKRFV